MSDIKDLAKELGVKIGLNSEGSLLIIEEYLQKAYDSNANIIGALKKARARAIEKDWKYIYCFFDIHETIIKPNYEAGNIPKEFYPDAKEVLQIISKRTDMKMHLYTCSWPHEVVQYNEYFKENGINFDFLDNKNPEVENNALGYYENKAYYNFLAEDKAGFVPEHWKYIKKYLEENPDSNL